MEKSQPPAAPFVHSRMAAHGLLVALLFCGACHADWDEPKEQADSSAQNSSPLDGGVDSTVATALDASPLDGSAATPLDATTNDAQQTPADATVAGFCNGISRGASTLCTDLEMGPLIGPPLAFDWAEPPMPEAQLVNEGKASGPRVMKSVLKAVSTPEGQRACWSVEENPISVSAAFDFLPSLNLPVTPGALVTWYKAQQEASSPKAGADAGLNTYYPGVSLGSRHDGTFLVIANSDGTAEPTYDEYPISVALPQGWFRVEIEIKYGAPGSVVVKYNGVVVLQLTDKLIQKNKFVYHQLGLMSQQPTVASSALYDNILLDAVVAK